ncbi:hypothetical protein REPUB_Repub03eG0122000 [Reevesia pubescens]
MTATQSKTGKLVHKESGNQGVSKVGAGASSSGFFNGLLFGSNMSPFGGESNLTYVSKPQEFEPHHVPCMVSVVHESLQPSLVMSPRALPQQNSQSDMVVDSVEQVQEIQALGNDSSAISNVFLDKAYTVLWKANIGHVDIVVVEDQLISLTINDAMNRKWVLSAIYASLMPSVKDLFWNYLANLHTFDSLPWLLIGDFNQIRSSSEKQGGRPEPLLKMRPFREVMVKRNLIDLEAKGCRFT